MLQTQRKISFISVNRAATILGYSRPTIYRYLESGKIMGYHIQPDNDRRSGGWWRVNLDSVYKLKELLTGSTAERV